MAYTDPLDEIVQGLQSKIQQPQGVLGQLEALRSEYPAVVSVGGLVLVALVGAVDRDGPEPRHGALQPRPVVALPSWRFTSAPNRES